MFRLSAASGVVCEMNGAQGAHILVLGLKVHAPIAHSANCPPVSRPDPLLLNVAAAADALNQVVELD
jgi:hypothetical protein